jgi:hypothetical protein
MRGRSAVVGLVATGVLVTAFGAVSEYGAAADPGPGPVVHHQPSGCGKALTVFTPAGPDRPMTAAALHLPAQAQGLFERAARQHARWLPAITCEPRQRRHPVSPAPDGALGADVNSDNWSGYQVVDPSPTDAQAAWFVPSVAPNGTSAYSNVWPGIGGGFGSGSGKLIQDGTEQDVLCSAGGCRTDTHFWFEVFPDEAELAVTNVTVSPGDAVATDASWNPADGAHFTMCDYTVNVCVATGQSSAAPGTTAECIVERPSFPSGLPPLANFGSVGVQNCTFNSSRFAAGSANLPIGQAGPQSIDMFSDAWVPLASTGDLGGDGTSFTVTWQNGQ